MKTFTIILAATLTLTALVGLTGGVLFGLVTKDYNLAMYCVLPLGVVCGVVGGLAKQK